LANQASNFIWFISSISPVIRKYNYEGNFLTEYQLSNVFDAVVKLPKRHNTDEIIFRPWVKPTLVINEQFLVLFNFGGLFILDLDEHSKKNLYPVQFINQENDKIIYPGLMLWFYSNGHYFVVRD